MRMTVWHQLGKRVSNAPRRGGVWLVLLLGAAAVGYGKEEPPPGKASPAEPRSVDLARVKPDVVLTHDKLEAQVGAGKFDQYMSKVLEVTGVIEAYMVAGDTPFLAFHVPRSQRPTERGAVMFFMADRYPWVKAWVGQTATVRGRVAANPFSSVPQLVDCVVVKAKGPSPVKKLAVDTAAKEFKSNKAKAIQKRRGKWYALEGKVVETKSDFELIVVLQGTGGAQVRCGFLTDLAGREPQKLRKGQKISVLGEADYREEAAAPYFARCRLLQPPK